MTSLVIVLLRVVLAAAWMVWHVRLGIAVSTSRSPARPWWRHAAWIPPLSPAVAWRLKLRGASIVWVLLAAAYLAVTVAA